MTTLLKFLALIKTHPKATKETKGLFQLIVVVHHEGMSRQELKQAPGHRN